MDCKVKWSHTCDWNLTALPRHKQKPQAITKQKADQERKLRNRNLDRAKQLGKQYIQKKTGMKL